MEVKPALTFEQQLERLKSKGCLVENDEFALDFLKRVNYYRFTAYFLSYKKDNDKYIDDTKFENIINIYNFDIKMRSLCFSAIEEIEIMLRTQIAYIHAHKYGPLGYTVKNNFKENIDKNDFNDFREHIQNCKRQNQNSLIIKHHNNKYDGNIPIWAISEFFTLGLLSKFYSNMKNPDKKEIAKVFGFHASFISSWLHCLTLIRNMCAHYNRLYNCNFNSVPKSPGNLNIEFHKKLFDYILIMKLLYIDKDKWNNNFFINLSTLIEEYDNSIDLRHIGFPSKWEVWLKN